MTDIEKLSEILSHSSNAVFFGGAGMSTESGIPDFRSASGIYNQKLHKTFSPEEMASYEFRRIFRVLSGAIRLSGRETERRTHCACRIGTTRNFKSGRHAEY